MTRITKPLICILFYFALTTSHSASAQQIDQETLISASYRPPVFIKDDRAEKIKRLAPAIEKLILDHAEEKQIPGIAYGIVVDGELVLANATGMANLERDIAATTSSAFRIASMTKSFTTMAIMKLRDEGKLSLKDPVLHYIPEMARLVYPTSDSPLITIENLMTMTPGFPEDNPWGDRQLDEPDQMLIDLITDGISFSNPPSQEYEYSNTGYAMLGNIISRVSGMSYQEYITENILEPLGMESTYWDYAQVQEDQLAIGYRWEDGQWKLEPMLRDGSFGAIGGMITTIEDFARYVSLHLSAWPARSDEELGPVKRNTLREMHTPQFPRLYANAKDYNGEPCATMSGYGYGLGINQDCHGRKGVRHGGALPGFGSNFVFYPEYGIGLMAFGNLTYTAPWPFTEIEKLLFEEARLEARQLPVSDILALRKEQVVDLIKYWNRDLEDEILAENFYLDRSREHRMGEAQKIMSAAGNIIEIQELQPQNQLRGSFRIQAENGLINVFFTLNPENPPKVQALNLSFTPN